MHAGQGGLGILQGSKKVLVTQLSDLPQTVKMVLWLHSAERPTCPRTALCKLNIQSTALLGGATSL